MIEDTGTGKLGKANLNFYNNRFQVANSKL